MLLNSLYEAHITLISKSKTADKKKKRKEKKITSQYPRLT